MSRVRIQSLLLLAVFAASLTACASSDGGKRSRDDSAVVAQVERGVIRQQELDAWLKEDWFASQSQDPAALYKLRREGLERLVDQRVLEAEAQRTSMSEEEVLRTRIEAKGAVTDAEVQAFYEQNKSRIRQDQSLEQLSPRIREFLEEDRAGQVMADLRREAGAEIVLDPPRYEIAGDGPSRGPADARITIQEFSDYECPYCQRAEVNIEKVLERYPDDVRLVYRHFPLEFHANARGAAEAAVCAEAQGKFWEYHALLFANQKNLGREALVIYAQQLGLDGATFDTCLASDATRERIDADIAAARATGSSATPTFFINGILLRGAKPAGEFAEIIDREIARLDAEAAAEAAEQAAAEGGEEAALP